MNKFTPEQMAAIIEAKKAIDTLNTLSVGIWYNPENSDLVAVNEADVEGIELSSFGYAPEDLEYQEISYDEYFDDTETLSEGNIGMLPDDSVIWVKMKK